MKKQKWTVSHIPSLRGKTILITGANSGLGYSCAEMLASKEASIIMACRNIEKGAEAQKRIQAKYKNARTEVIQLDLADFSSISFFAQEFHKNHNRLDILINNAGIMMTPWKLSADGIENQMATNHFGHFALTGLLWDLLGETPGSRIVSVSSLAHRMGKINPETFSIQNKASYSATQAYSDSKLANLLFTNSLQKYFDEYDINSKAVAAHPGASLTNLGSHFEKSILYKFVFPLATKVLNSSNKGARAIVRAAVDPSIIGGEYFGPKGLFELWGYPGIVKSSSKSRDKNLMDFLWEESEKITGIRFNF